MTSDDRAALESERDALFAAGPSSDDPDFWRGLYLRDQLDDTDEGDDDR